MKVPSMWNQYLVCPDKTLQRLQQVRNDYHDHFIVDVDVVVDDDDVNVDVNDDNVDA